ncbi:GM26821 [Drosophila sechellia]|uniref:GM19355 n=1 Tax=Drosophila sechellia TaxID=7238 RepID=B4IN85_DROSE|nr:GM19355 [Drosophila sechellia]EDW44589.1 GM26821 [Drosophila sechellia]
MDLVQEHQGDVGGGDTVWAVGCAISSIYPPPKRSTKKGQDSIHGNKDMHLHLQLHLQLQPHSVKQKPVGMQKHLEVNMLAKCYKCCKSLWPTWPAAGPKSRWSWSWPSVSPWLRPAIGKVVVCLTQCRGL